MTEVGPNEHIADEAHTPLDVILERDESRWTLVMRRRFRCSSERLWEMLTDPTRLALWSPIVPDRPLTETGPAACREDPSDGPRDAEVLLAEPPSLLVHRWGGDLMRWTITSVNGGVTLELRQSFDEHAAAATYAAGWHLCFARLAADSPRIADVRVTGERAADYGWQRLHDRYDAMFSVADNASRPRENGSPR